MRLEKLPHNIGIERTGRDPVRETIHTLNVPRQSEFQDTQRLVAAAETSIARTRPLAGRLSLVAPCAKPRQEIREAARITGVAGTGTR